MGSAEFSILDRLTLAEIKAVAEELGVQGIVGSIKRFTAGNYQQFVDVLCSDINDIVLGMQENPELRRNDGEDRLTIEIASILRGMGYNAGHEIKIGGHTDLSVRGRKNYLWIGEAKIHSSYDYLFQGFQQLCTRYATGDTNQDSGGLIIYIKNKDAAAVVRTWRERLVEYGLEELSLRGSEARPEFEFNSSHKLERSGALFNVKHIGVSLHFDPKDKV